MEPESVEVKRPHRWHRNPDVVFPLLLLLLGILFFADLLFTSKNFYFRDVTNFHYPLRKVMIDSWARGELPLWNPRVYLGQPMLANPNYMALYPTNLLHLVLPFGYAFKLHLILHVMLAGLGAYFLQRRLRIAPLPSFAGSLIYQFSGTVVSFLNLFSITQTVALLPWVGWAFLGCVQRFTRLRVLAFGALFSLQFITMEPLMLQCVFWLIAALAAIHLLEAARRTDALKTLLKTAFWGTLFAVGLSAAQLIPSLELLRLSSRGGGYAAAVLGHWSMHPSDLLNILVPNLFGMHYSITSELYWGEKFHFGREGYLVSLYLGTAAFTMGLVSFFSSRKKVQAVFLSLAFVATVLALGPFGYVYPWIQKWLPVMRFGRYPVKYMLLATLALAILAALGFEAVLNRQSAFHRRCARVCVCFASVLIIGALLLGFSTYLSSHSLTVEGVIRSWTLPKLLPLKNFKGIAAQLVQSFRWAGLFAMIASVLIAAARFWKQASLIACLLVFAAAAELLSQNARHSPLISGADFEYVSEVDKYVTPSTAAETYRVYHVEPVGFLPIKTIWAPNRSVAWVYLFFRRSGEPLFGIMNGVQYSISRSIDDLNTWESDQILRKGYTLKADGYLNLLGRVNSTVLLSVGEVDSSKAVLRESFHTGSERKVNVYDLKDASPRAFFAQNVDWVESPEKALDRLVDPQFPYRDTVILEGKGHPASGRQALSGSARILDYGNNSVRCQVEAGTDGYLVLLDSFYPGWRASVDGAPAQILRANYAFRAVRVPPGKHIVEFQFKPKSFYLGLVISCIAFFLGLGVYLSTIFRRAG